MMRNAFKIIIATGVPFGFFMAVFYGIAVESAMATAIAVGTTSGVIFGGLMAMAFAAVGHLTGQHAVYGSTGFSHVLEFAMTAEEARILCLNSLDSLNRKYRIVKSNGSASEIIVRTGVSWRSFGEIISFKITESRRNSVRIAISSRSRIPTTKVDWGINEQNVKHITRFIESHTRPENVSKRGTSEFT